MSKLFVRGWKGCVTVLLLVATAAAAEPKSLLEGPDLEQRIKPSSDQVRVQADDTGLNVTIEPGKDGYPGFTLAAPDGKTWDLSQYGHLEARIVNTGDKRAGVTVRIDDNGDWKTNPWNAEQTSIKPGETGKIHLIFGYSFGQKPGHKLKTDQVTQVLVFTGQQKETVSFRIESLVAAGEAGEKPAVDPKSIRLVPEQGRILGNGVKLDAEKQLKTTSATATAEGDAVAVQFQDKKDAQVRIMPAQGRWDLRQMLQVRVSVQNTGDAPVTPRVRLESNAGNRDWVAAQQPVAPGQTAEIIVPFSSGVTWNYSNAKTSGDKFGSDAVSAVVVAPAEAGSGAALKITDITADMPPTPKLPDWLGKRPPVEGDWTMTLEDNFDGDRIDDSIWNIYAENWWDKQSHFSKDNVIIGDGVVRLRFEKKRGHQNDDPGHDRVTDYATGFLDTYGKWVQRYGYFEARMKLPTAPGLWPAFWMMTDRVDAGPQWKRQDTKNDGMEFDIMEHLTRWGPYRYTIAMHWDGYGKEHKSTGATIVYFQPDADGFVTAGVLWTPGELVYYCNGREVARFTDERVASAPSDLMFTLPMGGWDNSPLDDSKLPDEFIIDYVRCWQRADLKSDADRKIDPPKTSRR